MTLLTRAARWRGLSLIPAALVLFAIAACAPSPPETQDGDGVTEQAEELEEVEDNGGPGEDHTPAPRYGGVLAELGDRAAHLEFVLDPEYGWVSMYVLDGHALDKLRLDASSIGAVFTITEPDDLPGDERTFTMALQPVESGLTGETAGDTGHFEASHERFRGAERFDVVVPWIEIEGVEYSGLEVSYRASDGEDGDGDGDGNGEGDNEEDNDEAQ